MLSLGEYLSLPVSSTLVLQYHYLCISPLCKFLVGLKHWEAVGSGVALRQVENSNARHMMHSPFRSVLPYT